MSSDAAAPPPEWDDPDETAPLVRDSTVPGERDATVRRARGVAGGVAEPVDDATVRSRRKASASGEDQADEGVPAPGRPLEDTDGGGAKRAASSPHPEELRQPYALRPVPVIAPRAPERVRPQAGPPVDSAGLARRIRIAARRRTAVVAAVSIVVLVASATLLGVLLSGGA